MSGEKRNFRDVEQIIEKAFNGREMDPVRDIVISVTGLLNPIASVGLEAADSVMKQYNDYKLKLLLIGLASGNNVEKGINELYNFVISSSEKAIAVANLFKQTINAESPKACVIYGIILAEHTEDNSDFTQEELILCKALENATDCDICNFKTIMEECITTNAEGVRKVKYLEGKQEKNEYTCEWAAYNRIFKLETSDFGELNSENDEYESFISDTSYKITPIADMLLEKIREVQQVLYY